MSQEANAVDTVGGSGISLELAHSLLNEITRAKNELSAAQRELVSTRHLYEQSQSKLEQISDLQCRISLLQNELKGKDKELQDTRAVLGKVTVENQRLRQAGKVVAEPPNSAIDQLKPSLKRVRSPSLEIIEISRPFIKDVNETELKHVLDPPKFSIALTESINEQKNVSSNKAQLKEAISTTSGNTPEHNAQSPPESKRIKVESMTRSESRAAETSRGKPTPSEEAALHTSSLTTSRTQNTTQPQPASIQHTLNASSEMFHVVLPSNNQVAVEKVPSDLSSITQNSTQHTVAYLTRNAGSAYSTLSVPHTPCSYLTAPGNSNVLPSTSSAHIIRQSTAASRSKGSSASCAQTIVPTNSFLPEREVSSNSTLPSLSIGPTSSIVPEAELVKVKFMRKTSEPMLPASTVDLYLESCRTLNISPPPLDLQVPRKFISNTYGGNPQTFITLTRKIPSGPDSRRMVFPMLDLNPFVPHNPGEPGLIFASRHEILSNPPWTVFVKRQNVTPALWIYQGEYECTLCGTMTIEEFVSQTPLVQKRWAKAIYDANIYDVYVIMRARIALRKAGLIPVEDQDAEKIIIEGEMQAIKRHRGLPVSLEDIIAAFHRGDEAIDIIRMNCIDYDHVFANHMKAKFLDYRFVFATDKRKPPATSDLVIKKRKSASAQPVRTRGSAEGLPLAVPLVSETGQPVASTPSVPEGSLRRSSRQRSARVTYTEDWY